MANIAKFLETDFIYALFSNDGLVALSLFTFEHLQSKFKSGSFCSTAVNLRWAANKAFLLDRYQIKLITETSKFIESGCHDMPLDFSLFTIFQQKVFRIVSQIPPGTSVTYKEIASLLGNPRSARAVGLALAQNPVAYFLPTHRVLPSSGGIGICKSGAGHLRYKLLKHEGLI